MTKQHFLPIDRLALIGVGMIGGSFVWSLKRAGMVNHVVGVDTDMAQLETATELGIIDSKSSLEGLQDIDFVVLAVPVGVMPRVFDGLKHKAFIKTALITDVGSTKSSVIKAAQERLGYVPERMIPSHPVAGREHSGVAHAEECMFHGYRVIVTPHDNADSSALSAIQTLWQACGASVDLMSATNHDRILAATSHLPHVLAYALVESLATTQYESPIFDYAAGGFKSFTRTASSNPTMWRDICLNNRQDILYWLDRYQETLSSLRDLISDGDGEAIIALFERAKAERDKYLCHQL